MLCPANTFIKEERFADSETGTGFLMGSCPRSFHFVRVAHFGQDDRKGLDIEQFTTFHNASLVVSL